MLGFVERARWVATLSDESLEQLLRLESLWRLFQHFPAKLAGNGGVNGGRPRRVITKEAGRKVRPS